MAKKYYKALDHVILSMLALRKGDKQTAAQHMTEAAEADDAEEMLDDLNAQQEGDDVDELTSALTKVKSKKAVKAEAEDEDEDTAEEEISAALASLTSKKKVRASDDNSDLEDVEGDAGGEREAVEDEVVARMEARRIRAQANLKRMRGK